MLTIEKRITNRIHAVSCGALHPIWDKVGLGLGRDLIGSE